MTLEPNITKSICDFIKLKPRSIQEIALHIKKNWRTTERYVEKIEKETGAISTRIFRKGTRGALKIVFWNSIEDIHSTSFQNELLDNIMQGKRKTDFSPFDIYQYIENKDKKVQVEDITRINPNFDLCKKTDFAGLLRKAEKQILVFSGNLSWINGEQGETKIIDVIKELARRNVSIKVISRVSLVGEENVKKILEINKEIGKEIIEVRHRYQPLRGLIIDDKIINLRERKDPAYYNPGELTSKIEIFYTIYNREWAEWLQKVFWKMFSSAMPAEKRLKEIEMIQKKIE